MTVGTIQKLGFLVLSAVIISVLGADASFAQSSAQGFAKNTNEIDDIAQNIVASSAQLPGLVTGLSYLLGLILGIMGIFNLKDNVENPTNVPARQGFIRLLAAGSLFALPSIYEAMFVSITGADGSQSIRLGGNGGSLYDSIFGTIDDVLSFVPSFTINNILENIIDSIETLPGIFSAAGYLLGLILGIMGVIKLKEHVENPSQVKLNEGITRLFIGGLFFALPVAYGAMQTAISGSGNGFFSDALDTINDFGQLFSSQDNSVTCSPVRASFIIGEALDFAAGTNLTGQGPSMGQVMCNILSGSSDFTRFLNAIAYLFGITLGFWAILKIRDHILNPTQTPVWDGIARLIAAGAFFSLPVVVEAFRATITPDTSTLGQLVMNSNTGFAGGGAERNGTGGLIGSVVDGVSGGGGDSFKDILGGVANSIFGIGGGCDAPSGGGLDTALTCLMSDIFGPMQSLLNFFGIVAGTILIMIGISRLLKTAQDGARGPGGIGTMMTFLVGGALVSFNQVVTAFSTTLFSNPTTLTYATLNYGDEGPGFNDDAFLSVISAVLKFMILIGLISFVRGLFILRDVAEGGQQASLMSSMTHLIGGALAVNLGPLLNAVQATLGIVGFNLQFT